MDPDPSGPQEGGPAEGGNGHSHQRALVAELEAVHSSASDVIARCDAAAKSAEESATGAQQRIAAALTQVDSEAATVAANVVQIQNAAQVSEDAKAKAALALEETARSQREAAAAAQTVKEQQANANADAAATKEVRATAETARAEIEALRGKVQEHLASALADRKATARLAATADALDERVKGHEKRLQDLILSGTERSKALSDQIESLLPSATSAGLAAAFDARRRDIIRDRKLWTIAFVACLLTLAIVSYLLLGRPLVDDSNLGVWPSLVISLIRRFAAIGPLLWFAILAAKQVKTLFRIEEEYAHKVVMSNSFEGYKRQVSEVGEEGALGKLTASVIDVIRRPPGRFYDKAVGSDSPLEELADKAPKILEPASKVLKS